MDVLLNNEILSDWLIQYGSIALFVLMVVGIIILPVPEETLMVIAGVLIQKGEFAYSNHTSCRLCRKHVRDHHQLLFGKDGRALPCQ